VENPTATLQRREPAVLCRGPWVSRRWRSCVCRYA